MNLWNLHKVKLILLTLAYSAVTVLSDNLRPSPPDPLSTNERKDSYNLDTNEETIEEKIEELEL